MFVDKAKITIKAGNGGDGAVSFHREKYVALGGPAGGDGGRGGSIIFWADPNMHTLLDFRYTRKYFAENGEKGRNHNQSGPSAEDLVIAVPPGTLVRDVETGHVVADLYEPDLRRTVLAGGRGGRGNARFKTPTRQAPRFAQSGQRTRAYQVFLELKTIADVGLVGFPNVGKSTLLSVLTRATPKIANYHFTTLAPNLGVCRKDGVDFVLADIPGLIEGASAGAGLGHDFLRHVERTRMLVHVLDTSGSENRDPLTDFDSIMHELSEYSQQLATRPQIVAANKMDVTGADLYYEMLEEKLNELGIPVVPISAATHTGLEDLLQAVIAMLRVLPEEEREIPTEIILEPLEKAEYTIERLEEDLFVLEGTLIDRMQVVVDLEDHASFVNFQNSLKQRGIIEALKQAGCQEGHTVRLGEVEFEFVE